MTPSHVTMQPPLKGIRDIIIELNVMTNNKNLKKKSTESDEEHLKK